MNPLVWVVGLGLGVAVGLIVTGWPGFRAWLVDAIGRRGGRS